MEPTALNFNDFGMDGLTPIKRIRISVRDLNKRDIPVDVDLIVPLVPQETKGDDEATTQEEEKGKRKGKAKGKAPNRVQKGKRKRGAEEEEEEKEEAEELSKEKEEEDKRAKQRVLRSLLHYFGQQECFSEETMKALHAIEERYREQQLQQQQQDKESKVKVAAKKKKKTQKRPRGRPRKKAAEEEEEEEGKGEEEEGEGEAEEGGSEKLDVAAEIVELIKREKLVFLMELYKRNPEGVEKEVTTIWKAPTPSAKRKAE